MKSVEVYGFHGITSQTCYKQTKSTREKSLESNDNCCEWGKICTHGSQMLGR